LLAVSAKLPTRRSFLGWWIGGLLAATAASVVAPLGVYLFPPRSPNMRKVRVRVALPTPVADIPEGGAALFDSPPGMAFTMVDGGEANAPGDPTFGGYLVRDGGRLRAFAVTCPHLGCSYSYDDGLRHFLCPCHGSQFALDGSVIKGPATAPLSHLSWRQGAAADEIDVDGLLIP
jgi:cytochrome b6-f complex iron-sulfur subunit